MVAGYDRYFQIARCFRDEDLRADRQPEFTQIDLEASFVSTDDVMAVVEKVLLDLWAEAGQSVQTPFLRMPWREAMERFGVDKPDLRYDLEIRDLTLKSEPTRRTSSSPPWPAASACVPSSRRDLPA